MIVSELAGAVRVGGERLPPLDATVAITGSGELEADAALSAALADATLPRGRHQVVGFRVYVGGVELPASSQIAGMTITRSLGERATWSFTLPQRSDWPIPLGPPLGSPDGFAGPPPGKARVDIEGLYATPEGIKAVPLITGGVVDNSDEDFGPLDQMTVRGLGPGGRVDQRKVTLTLEPGHGSDRAQVISTLAAQAGASPALLESSGRMDKELQAVEQDFLSLGNDLLAPVGRVLHWSADGELSNPLAQGELDGRIDWVITESDLRAEGSRRSATADGPTKVQVTGTRQIAQEECGRRAEVSWVESYEVFAPQAASWVQASDGSLSAAPGSQPASLRLRSRVVTVRELECDDVISEREIVQGWFAPQSYRYELATDGSFSGFAAGVYIFEADAQRDDGASAFTWAAERFTTITDTLTTRRYDGDGYLVETVTTVRAWGQRKAPVKEQGVTRVPWEEVDFRDGVKVLAGGEGVEDPKETFFGPLYGVSKDRLSGEVRVSGRGVVYVPGSVGRSQTTTSISATEGFRQQESASRRAWFVRLGAGDYLYQGAGESIDGSEVFDVDLVEDTTYSADGGESSHSSTVVRRGPDGQLLRGDQEAVSVERGVAGYLPAAERRGGQVGASRNESQRMEFCVEAMSLEDSREPSTVEISSTWSESEAELEGIGVRHLREQSAFDWALSLPAALGVLEGHRLLVDLPSVGISARVHGRSVAHSDSPGEIVSTTIQGKQYVV